MKKAGKSQRRRQINRLIERDGPTCAYCGCSLTRETATRDHVIPLSKGGTSGLDNLVLSCGPCNRDKGDDESVKPEGVRGARHLPIHPWAPAEVRSLRPELPGGIFDAKNRRRS